MKKPTLKPCPACGNNAMFASNKDWVFCTNYVECHLVGPNNDPDGRKWNAMPRRRTKQKRALSQYELETNGGVMGGPGNPD